MSNTYRITGSYGYIDFDISGAILRNEGYEDVVKIDVQDYYDFYGHGPVDVDDVLCYGGWLTDGTYFPANRHTREGYR